MSVHPLHVRTRGPGLLEITRAVDEVIARSGVAEGLATVFVRHTSASLVIQENADPAVGRDMTREMERLVPEGSRFEHDAEGSDDMPAHVRSALTSATLTIPVLDGRMRLGTWQAIHLWEHRRRGHSREIAVVVLGE